MCRTQSSRLQSLLKEDAAFVEPMERLAVSKLPEGSQWLWEIKLDGYRAIGVKSDRGVRLLSRRNKSFDHQYPDIVKALDELPENSVVDGEVVALDESGRPNFNLLRNFRSEASRINFFVFDLLVYEGLDLTRLPLIARRHIMRSRLMFDSPRIRVSDSFEVPSDEMLHSIRALGLEGIVGKRTESLYESGMPIRQPAREASFALGRRIDR